MVKDLRNSKEKIVFLNNKFLAEQDARISVLEPGLLYGWGLFETMRAYNQNIVYLRQHLERIKIGCLKIGIEFSYIIPELCKIIKKLVELNGLKDAYVRLSVYKKEQGFDIVIVARNYQPYPADKYKQGFIAGVASFKQNKDSFLAQIKSTSCIFYKLLFMEAKEKGLDEALILNSEHELAEGSRSNLFMVKNGLLFTPSLSCGCLGGITRRVILDLAKKHKIKVEKCAFSLKDLLTAEEAFLTNSLIGVMPLVSVEKINIGNGKVGRLTKFFMRQYDQILKATN